MLNASPCLVLDCQSVVNQLLYSVDPGFPLANSAKGRGKFLPFWDSKSNSPRELYVLFFSSLEAFQQFRGCVLTVHGNINLVKKKRTMPTTKISTDVQQCVGSLRLRVIEI